MSREAHVPFYERPEVQLLRPTHRSELGAEQLGILQSLVATCRLQGVDTYTYLVDVMQRVASHPAKDVEQLTPRIWKQCFANEPLPSLMELLETQSVIVHDTSTES